MFARVIGYLGHITTCCTQGSSETKKYKQHASAAIWITSAAKGYLRGVRPAPDSSTGCTCGWLQVGLIEAETHGREARERTLSVTQPSVTEVGPLPETAADEVTGERAGVLSLLHWFLGLPFLLLSGPTTLFSCILSYIITALYYPIHCILLFSSLVAIFNLAQLALLHSSF